MQTLNEWEKAILWTINGDVSLVDESASDIRRVQCSLQRVTEHSVTLLEAAIFWEWRSNDYDAGFLALPTDDGALDEQVGRYVEKLVGKREGDEACPDTLKDPSVCGDEDV